MLINKLIKKVEKLELDLKDKVVLTEAASGAYIVTPLLAALAGAKVYAYSKTTPYGKVEEIFRNTKKLIRSCKKYKLNINFIEKITPEIISQADVITNSGHLRPLTKDMLQNAKDSMVIPLMYEAWEKRNNDMDFDYIRQRGFRIGATNERHPEVDVFNYLGDMAIKQIFDAGSCPYNNKFVLISNNDFGPFIAKVLAKMCSGLAVIDKDENKAKYDLENIKWIGKFPNISIPEEYKDSEAIIFTAYPFNQNWIGLDTPISAQDICSQFKSPLILRYAGDLDTQALSNLNIKYYPSIVKSGHMGILPSEIGLDPIIRLQSGGLKVGECLLKNTDSYKGVKILDLMY